MFCSSSFPGGRTAFLTCYWPNQGRGQCGGVFWARRSCCEQAGSGFEAGGAPSLRHGLFSGTGEVPGSPKLGRRSSLPLRRGRPAACSCPGVCTAGQACLRNARPCARCSPLEGVPCRSQSPTRGSQYSKPGWEAARAWGFLGNLLLCFFPFKASSEAFGLQASKHCLSGICRALEFQTQP